jgi:glycosyltransferase involved in cell wall biosynthesis
VANHCLLVTHLELYQLHAKNHGTYRRLSMLVDAIRPTGLSLRVFCTIAPDRTQRPLADIAAEIKQEIAAIWQIEAEVTVSPLGEPSKARWLLQQLAGITGYANTPLLRTTFTPAAYDLLAAELAHRPALIVAHRLPSMFALSNLPMPLPPTFFDLDDIEHTMALRTVHRLPSLRAKILTLAALPALWLAERRAVRHARSTFVCSEIDARHARQLFGTASISVLPNSVAIPPVAARPATGLVMLMVGIYSYGPNADGAEFFIEEILPLVRSRIPGAEIWLAGSTPEYIKAFKDRPEGVRFLGFVDDIDSLYREARIIICPIRYGSGTRVKLVEAAAWGKAIVSTTLGAEGLGMTHGQDVLLADSAEAFAAGCARLLQDDALSRRLAENARTLAQRTFDRQEIVRTLAIRFQQALPQHSR